MQMSDLKSKDMWSGEFVEVQEQVGRIGSYEMHERRATQVDNSKKKKPRIKTLVFDERNSLPECYSVAKKLAFGVLTTV